MEQTISEIGSSSSTISHQSKENETKKRPNFTDAESYPESDDISSGKRICLEGSETGQTAQETMLSHESPRKNRCTFNSSDETNFFPDGITLCKESCLDDETVQTAQEMMLSHESPKKERHSCNSSGETNCLPDGITLCKDSCLDGDSPQSAVSDTYTQADGSRSTLIEESMQTCQTENKETIDASEEEGQKPKAKVLCSSTGDLQNSSVRTTLTSSTDSFLVSGSAKNMATAEHDLQKDGDPVNQSKESLCGENGSTVNNATDAVPALISAETSQSMSSCQEDKPSEQRNVEAAGNCRRKLLILDVNGLLADILPCPEPGYVPDTQFAMKAVFKRTFCSDFLQFCFDNFNVGVWSSRNRKNVERVVDFLMGDKKKNLLFCWDQSHCTDTGYGTVRDRNKPLFLKEIKKLWDKEDPNLPWEKGDYNESNTLLMDDSPYKALRNPPYTGIFPDPYVYKDHADTFLGPKGRLRSYLQRLVKAEDVQKFVEKNPFGQRPITKSNSSWALYSKIINPTGSIEPEKKGNEPKHNDEQEPPCEASASEVETRAATAEGSPK